MNFDYTEEQQLLAESVRRFVARDYTFDARTKIVASPEGMSAPIWATFAAMGLLGIALPESVGGFAGGAVDLMTTMEAIGEALVSYCGQNQCPWRPPVSAWAQVKLQGQAKVGIVKSSSYGQKQTSL